MAYQIVLREVTPQLVAAVHDVATLETLTGKILGSPVWNFLRARSIRSGGHNVVVYHDLGRREFAVEIGADVLEPFEDAESVICTRTPGGLVATTKHVGPYALLKEAHDAVRRWCRDEGHRLSGTLWEVYGHWNEDPTKLATDVFHLIEPPAR